MMMFVMVLIQESQNDKSVNTRLVTVVYDFKLVWVNRIPFLEESLSIHSKLFQELSAREMIRLSLIRLVFIELGHLNHRPKERRLLTGLQF